MTRKEFKACMSLALNFRMPLLHVDIEALHGCALPGFGPALVTTEVAAAHLRWQCVQLNGQVDNGEMDNCWHIFRHKVHLIDGPMVMIEADEGRPLCVVCDRLSCVSIGSKWRTYCWEHVPAERMAEARLLALVSEEVGHG